MAQFCEGLYHYLVVRTVASPYSICFGSLTPTQFSW